MPAAESTAERAPSPDLGIAARERGALAFLRRYPLALLAACVIVLAFLAYPFSAQAASVLFATVLVLGGVPLCWKTLRNMAAGRFHVDTVAAIAIVSAGFMGEYLAGAVVVLMQAGGEALEDYGLHSARRSLDNLLRRAPSHARVRRGDNFVDISASEVAVGDILLIRPGDIIAADGTLVEGDGEVDESALTGEPVPLRKSISDRVFSGTVNLAGSFLIRTTSTAAESKYELIVRMVQQAQGERAPINRLANQYTPPFTLLTLGMAGAALLFTHDASRALAVLVVATPCPLIIATPLAVISAVNRAAALNIIVKSGAAIEQASQVEILVFDKTGTLTVGTPSLGELALLDPKQTGNGQNEALRLAAALELRSPHVLGAAVVRAARERGLAIPDAGRVTEQPGSGLSGSVEGVPVALGSAHYLRSLGLEIPPELTRRKADFGRSGSTVALLAIDGRCVGLLVFEDRLRPESTTLMGRLDRLGIHRRVMLTGDAPETAEAIASAIGITDVRSRLHPEDKVTALRELAATGSVMMVGDGINDAPALATANVGIAMGGYGAGIATDAADVVITVENVERVADTIEIGRRMVRVAKQGIFLGMGASLLSMVGAFFGFFPPAVGALIQEAIDLAAILNALRAR